jgi:hypothetical protein
MITQGTVNADEYAMMLAVTSIVSDIKGPYKQSEENLTFSPSYFLFSGHCTYIEALERYTKFGVVICTRQTEIEFRNKVSPFSYPDVSS